MSKHILHCVRYLHGPVVIRLGYTAAVQKLLDLLPRIALKLAPKAVELLHNISGLPERAPNLPCVRI